MNELGRILRITRESQHLTLDEIQERTKIRKHYLQAIEEGNLSVLPGLVYARGFIRNYAEQLGLDGQALLMEHGLLDDPTPSAQKQVEKEESSRQNLTRSRSQKTQISSRERESSLLPQVLMGVAVIGLLGVGLWFLSNRENASSQPPTPPVKQPAQNQTPAAQPEPSIPSAPKEEEKVKEPLKTEEKDDKKSVYKITGDKLKLELSTPNEDCWLEVFVDGESVPKISKVVPKGTTLDPIEAAAEIKVVSGASPALSIKVNDRPVELEQVRGRYEFVFQKK